MLKKVKSFRSSACSPDGLNEVPSMGVTSGSASCTESENEAESNIGDSVTSLHQRKRRGTGGRGGGVRLRRPVFGHLRHLGPESDGSSNDDDSGDDGRVRGGSGLVCAEEDPTPLAMNGANRRRRIRTKEKKTKKGSNKGSKKTNALCKLMRSRYRRHLVRSFLISLFLIIILAEFTGLVRWRMADIVPLRVYRAEEKYGYKDDAADDYEYEDDDLPPVVEEKNNGLMERLKGLRFGVPPEYDAADRHFDPEGKTVAKHLDRNAVPRPPLGQDRQYDDKNAHLSKFYSVAKKTREAFAERYGGAEMAETILNLGVASFGHVLAESEEEEMAEDDRALARGLREAGITGITSDLLHTSKRILAARQDDRPFVMAFAGYSTTVGRGNYFNQSYPFVAERILREPMLELLGDGTNSGKFIVRNAGIGGIPSFPYGWCLENFLGSDADVVSWEFTLNEAGGIPGGLEAYVRHVSSMPNVPKLIVKDSPKARGRLEVLRKYSKKNVLRDAVAVYSDLAAEDFVSMKKEERPPGFKNWEEFGAPPGSPGQVKWHPTHQEHALYGWMIAMHILTSMELAAKLINLGLDKRTFTFKSPLLPRPLFPPHNTDEKPISVLVGDPIDGPLQEPTSPWLLNRVSCRTSFEPHLKDEGTLKDIVVSGLAPEKVDILLPKGMMTYGKGWVWDIGDSERKAKNRLTVHDGGLGFIDSKTALYGLPISGMLNLWLPWEGTTGGWQATHHTPSVGDRASKWFKSFVICEVNEKRTAKECKMDTDVDYFVGGASAASKVEKIVAPGVQYLTKDICVQVDVHSTSTLSSRPDDGSGSSSITGSGNVGLSVDVKVTGFLTLKDGACSISHVVWEQLGTSRSI